MPPSVSPLAREPYVGHRGQVVGSWTPTRDVAPAATATMPPTSLSARSRTFAPEIPASLAKSRQARVSSSGTLERSGSSQVNALLVCSPSHVVWRHAIDDRACRDVACDERSRADKSLLTDGDSGEDDRTRADLAAVAKRRW
jgi:hypothetical protein